MSPFRHQLHPDSPSAFRNTLPPLPIFCAIGREPFHAAVHFLKQPFQLCPAVVRR